MYPTFAWRRQNIMYQLPLPIRSLLIGSMLAAGGTLLILLFAHSFHDGATWSPVTQRGGPGFMFVLGPAAVGWFWASSWVNARGFAALWQALGICTIASIAVVAGGLVLTNLWAAAPTVLESLFSTIAVALMVGTVAAVSVRLASEPNQE
jgi:hypothetical protein